MFAKNRTLQFFLEKVKVGSKGIIKNEIFYVVTSQVKCDAFHIVDCESVNYLERKCGCQCEFVAFGKKFK